MKRSIIYFLGAIAMLSSCTVAELGGDQKNSGNAVPEGKVLVTFDVTMPDAGVNTKAFADTPNIKHLYLAVFGEAGWKQEYVEATCVKAVANAPDPGTGVPNPKYSYTAQLSILEEDCTIHFLAFEDDEHSELKFGSEEEVIAEMYTEGDNVAYWNYVKIPGGIVYEENTTDLAESVASRLQYIPLVRNFAKFTISTATGSNFTLKEAKVINVPKKGYVAAYNKTNGGFIDGYQSYGVDELRTLGFIGSAPANGDLILPSDDDFTSITKKPAAGATSIVDYAYEAEVSTTNPVCLLVYGTYGGNDYWYRIDLVKSDDETQHYPIFRNFIYGVTISQVKEKGYADPESAYKQGSSGDISADVRYDDFNNISNGFSQIFVGFTEMVVVARTGETPSSFQIPYKFIPDISLLDGSNEAACVNNTLVTATAGEAPAAGAAFTDGSATWASEIAASWNGSTGTKDGQNYSYITVQPTASGSVRKVQEIVIKGTTEDGVSIQRSVSVVVLPQQTMYLSSIGAVGNSTGSDVVFYVSLPTDLPKSMFPLFLNVEAEKGTISPKAGENLTVETGRSIFDSNKPGYQFVRVVNLDEYQAASDDPDHDGFVKLAAPFRFVTTVGESATDIKVSNEYFIPGETSFVNSKGFTSVSAGAPVALGLNGSGQFSFSMSSISPVTISIENGTYTGSQLTSNGDGTYTYTPTATGVQTISGIRPSTNGKLVNVTISAEDYAPATVTFNRSWTIEANSITALDLGTNNLGYTGSWNNNTSSSNATVNAKLHGSSMTPVALSGKLIREVTGEETKTVDKEVSFSAPEVRVSRTGSSSPYTFTYTISNAEVSNYNYYWRNSNSGDGTKITLNSDNKFTLTNNNKDYTIYIIAKHLVGGVEDGNNSGWSTVRCKNGGSTEFSIGSNGKYTVSEEQTIYTYKYYFSGPTTARDFTFTTDVADNAYFDLLYNNNVIGTLPISALVSE